jgi:hypothetical protein
MDLAAPLVDLSSGLTERKGHSPLFGRRRQCTTQNIALKTPRPSGNLQAAIAVNRAWIDRGLGLAAPRSSPSRPLRRLTRKRPTKRPTFRPTWPVGRLASHLIPLQNSRVRRFPRAPLSFNDFNELTWEMLDIGAGAQK